MVNGENSGPISKKYKLEGKVNYKVVESSRFSMKLYVKMTLLQAMKCNFLYPITSLNVTNCLQMCDIIRQSIYTNRTKTCKTSFHIKSGRSTTF